jgi:acyl dehydratase
MRYYEDIQSDGVVAAPGTYEITAEEIVEMGTRWDPQPFHIDPEAAKDSIFGGLVASSVHLFAIAVGLGHTRDEPTAAVTALGFKELQWHAPARPGDRLHLQSRVLSKRLSKSRPDCGIVESRSEVLNQDDALVFAYTSAALIRRKPDS